MGMVPPLAPRPISTPHVHGGTYEQSSGDVILADWHIGDHLTDSDRMGESVDPWRCPRWLKNFKLLRIRGRAPWKRFEFPKIAAVEPTPTPPKSVIWTGGSRDWGAENNWSGGVPASDDTLIFPVSPTAVAAEFGRAMAEVEDEAWRTPDA